MQRSVYSKKSPLFFSLRKIQDRSAETHTAPCCFLCKWDCGTISLAATAQCCFNKLGGGGEWNKAGWNNDYNRELLGALWEVSSKTRCFLLSEVCSIKPGLNKSWQSGRSPFYSLSWGSVVEPLPNARWGFWSETTNMLIFSRLFAEILI